MSLPVQILDMCTEIWLTTTSIASKDRLCIRKSCLLKRMEQGWLFEHHYAHYLFYYSNYFESLHHYSTIISIIFAIIHIISRDEIAFWTVFIAEMSPSGRSRSNISSLVVRHDQSALSYWGSRSGGRRSCSIGGLDVFQPTSTHGWTKLITKGFDRLGDIGAFVLPHVICNSKIQANLKQK